MKRSAALLILVCACLTIAVIVLFVQLDTTRKTLADVTATQAESTADLQTKLEALRGQLADQKAALEASDKTAGETKSRLESLKADLAKDAAAAMTKEIIASATGDAITQVIKDVASKDFEPLVGPLSKELATNYVGAFAGPPGKDADNERVAVFLTANPEFVEAVSLSILKVDKGASQ